jgi:ribA/ribD-fused uncharacterized protein
MEPILSFWGKNRFLSNFYPAEFVWDNIVWKHSEGAYQAAKSLNREVRLEIAAMEKPGATKRIGKRMDIRPDWNEVRDQIMYEIVLEKFRQNPELKTKLLATGDAHLEEGNTWNDRYWGVCPVGSGNGENKLGKTLMRVRQELGGAQ